MYICILKLTIDLLEVLFMLPCDNEVFTKMNIRLTRLKLEVTYICYRLVIFVL